MSQLALPVRLLDGIVRHLESAYPEEGVGALLGTIEQAGRRQVRRQVPLANAARQNRQRRYEVAPEDLVRLQRDARADGLEVVGYYHSHPEADPAPSSHDRHTAWPWYIYVIVRVGKGRADGVAAWQLRDDRSSFDPVGLEIVEV